MDTTQLRPFALSLPIALLKAREAVMGNFQPILAAVCLTEQQRRVLRALADADNSLSVNELAERAMLLGPSLSRTLTGLEARGLLDRANAPDDARRAVIAINRSGRALLAKIGPRSEALYGREEQLGADELAHLYDLLALVADVVVDHDRGG